MKLLRDKYSLTLSEVSIMFETNDMSVLKTRRWVPRWALRHHFRRFMLEFSELFNPAEVEEMVTADLMRLRITNRVNNLLHPLYMGLLLSDRKDFRDLYFELFGKKYNGKEDLKVILSEIDRMRSKMSEYTQAGTARTGAAVAFEDVITYVEVVLERSLPRDMLLFQFKHQYDLAVLRARELEKIRRNG